MRTLLATLFALTASPALAASKNPFSAEFWTLSNTDFIVSISFLIFVGVLIYFKVPGMLTGMLDSRADGIKSDIDEAKALREEAQTLLASYERKQREVQEQADRIVANAKEEAERSAAQAKVDMEAAVERRLTAAKEQIASAESAAVRQVRNRAITVAIAAAKDVIAKQTTADDANKLIDDAIAEVGERLH